MNHRWPAPMVRHAAALTVRGGSTSGDGDAGATQGPAEQGLDEALYSRQLYVMGKSAMARMGKADVLISGLR